MLSNHWQDAYELVREQALKFVSLLHNSACNVVVFSFSLNLYSFNWGRSVLLLQCLSTWSVYYSPCRGVFNRVVIVMAYIYWKLSLFLYDWACVVCGVSLFVPAAVAFVSWITRLFYACKSPNSLLGACLSRNLPCVYSKHCIRWFAWKTVGKRTAWTLLHHCLKVFWKVSSVLCLA